MRITLREILIALAAVAFPLTAVADDFSDLVGAVVRGPKANSAMTGMVSSVTGRKTKGNKRRVGVNLGEIAGTMSEAEALDGIAKAMTVSSALNVASHNRSKHSPKNNFTTLTMPTPEMGKWRPYGGDPRFFRPVPGHITSGFGYRPQFGRMHKGVDLHLNVGDTVRAAMGGTVELVAYDPDGYGHYVLLSHSDGVETCYGHLKRSLVVTGQYIRGGEALGLGGNTGNSTGPHLHFETRVMGVAMDPTMMFDFKSPVSYRGSMLASGGVDANAEILHTGFHRKAQTISDRRTYVVKAGDTVETIARRAGITPAELRRLNMLKAGDRLEEGRMLKLK